MTNETNTNALQVKRPMIWMILAILSAVILIGSITFATYLSSKLGKMSEESAKQDSILILDGTVTTFSTTANMLSKNINARFNSFAKTFDKDGWKVDASQKTQSGVPLVTNGGNKINEQWGQVDGFKKLYEDFEATVIVCDADIVCPRVSTTVLDAQKQRMDGKVIDSKVVLDAIKNDKPFLGFAPINNVQYFAKYGVLRSTDGHKVVGYVGMESQSIMDDLKAEVLSRKIGKRGRMFVFDSHEGKTFGNMLMHADETLVGTNFLEKTEAGSDKRVFEEILKRRGDTVRSEAGKTVRTPQEFQYMWKEPDGTIGKRMGWFQDIPELGMMVVATVSEDDLFEGPREVRIIVFACMFLLWLAISTAMYFVLRNRLQPISIIMGIMSEIARKNLLVIVPKKLKDGKDEIAALARSLDYMKEDLRGVIHSIQDLMTEIASSTTQISAMANNQAGRNETIGQMAEELASTSGSQLTMVQNTVEEMASIQTLATQIGNTASTGESFITTVDQGVEFSGKSFEETRKEFTTLRS